MVLVLPSAYPLPLLSATIDSIFTQIQPPNISLLSAPVLTTVAAGLRSALVVDIGWTETVVTSIYEFREVQSRRSIRGSKLLGKDMFKMLVGIIDPTTLDEASTEDGFNDKMRQALSFEECEDIVARVAWCKPARKIDLGSSTQGLAPVDEEDELRSSMRSLVITGENGEDLDIAVPLGSTSPPKTLRLPFSKLAEPCESALFASGRPAEDFDDEELPLHLLVYRSLLQLPVDVRTMCMSRIVFVGGGSNLLGLKERILDELSTMIEQSGWNPVRGRAAAQLRNNPTLLQTRRKQANNGPTEVLDAKETPRQGKISAAFVGQEHDPIEEHLKREANKGLKPVEFGHIRAVESLGAWAGGSLLSQLKVPAVSIIDREQWLQHGAAGASREIETSVTLNAKRQSLGPTVLKSGDRSSWTLGLWG